MSEEEVRNPRTPTTEMLESLRLLRTNINNWEQELERLKEMALQNPGSVSSSQAVKMLNHCKRLYQEQEAMLRKRGVIHIRRGLNPEQPEVYERKDRRGQVVVLHSRPTNGD